MTAKRRGPPPIESIVAGIEGRTDIGYDTGIHLVGLKGAWHRLWAAIALGVQFGADEHQAACEATVREQLEQALGRQLTVDEFDRLAADARAHGATMSQD
jgi:hypothetical protein